MLVTDINIHSECTPTIIADVGVLGFGAAVGCILAESSCTATLTGIALIVSGVAMIKACGIITSDPAFNLY